MFRRGAGDSCFAARKAGNNAERPPEGSNVATVETSEKLQLSEGDGDGSAGYIW